MQGPWYTFDEAQELLSLNRSELLYEIDSGAVRPVVTTKQRPFLVFKRDKDRRWIGLGTCDYRGSLEFHPDSITNLIENGEIKLGKGSARLLEPKKAKNWSGNYPFKQQPPFDLLAEWRGDESEGVDLSKVIVTPLPLEGESSTAFIGGLAKSAMQFVAKDDPILSNSKEMTQITKAMEQYPYAWSFDVNSKFLAEDLRIAASEIERFKTSKVLDQEEEQEPQSGKPLISRLEGKRTNQLHELFCRALEANPSVTAKQLWSIIQDDWESDTPLYDSESIITNMDESCVEWRSDHYNDQALKRSCFGPVLSKLKKKM